MKARRTQMLAGILACALIAGATKVSRAHEPLTEQAIQRLKQSGDYEERLDRVRRLGHYKVGPGVADRALFKLQMEALRANGLSPAEITERLFGGRMMAFPYAAQPELKSSGTVRTLTILIDFKDHRAAAELPGMDAAHIAQNIYGPGTAAAQAFKPYESVNAYYRRASQGKVDIQGDVLGWYHFPNARATYKPAATTGAAENKAIFDLATQALDSFDATHDFSQYDNDNDGDIDLISILYTGPDTGWGSFWWAYRWEFFVPQASTKTYDGKRLRQFVFEFVNPRAGSDFDPRTLLHETGHAFGLPDYYDYAPGTGPDGGIGGLDMMDANLGNHNAFSRWLLDWIQPECIASGAPSAKNLVASGSTNTLNKAIAVFPGLASTSAPGEELFLIENRYKTGNDGDAAGMPGNGVVVWHVLATPNPTGNGFAMDNSYTRHKLLRLVRADSAADFGANDSAGAGTYFNGPKELTPTSVPNSDGYGGPTNVAFQNIASAAESITIKVGLLSPSPSPSSPAPSAIAGAGALPAPAALAPHVTAILNPPVATGTIDIDRLMSLANQFQVAKAADLKSLWEHALQQANLANPSRDASVTLQLILTNWAAKDGNAAMQALLATHNSEFISEAYPRILEAWSNAHPLSAWEWFRGDERRSRPELQGICLGGKCTQALYKWVAMNSIPEAVRSLDDLSTVREVWGAMHAINDARTADGVSPAVVRDQLTRLKKNQEVAEAIDAFQDAVHVIDKHVTDPKAQTELRSLMQQRLK